jgi:hypothetical protein
MVTFWRRVAIASWSINSSPIFGDGFTARATRM